MKREFVVTDEEGNISWSAKTESSEKFSSFKAAQKRAEQLAQASPGNAINIYESFAKTICNVAAAKTHTYRAA